VARQNGFHLDRFIAVIAAILAAIQILFAILGIGGAREVILLVGIFLVAVVGGCLIAFLIWAGHSHNVGHAIRALTEAAPVSEGPRCPRL
jgi:hypothetical protein